MGCEDKIEREATKKVGRVRGKYHNDIEGNISDRAYRVWTAIINRCNGRGHGSYDGTVICDEWHTFSCFKQWYDSQQCPDDWQVDKDFLFKEGSKIYSPATCVMIPGYVNSIVGFRRNEFSSRVRGVAIQYSSTKGKGNTYVAQVSKFSAGKPYKRLKKYGKCERGLHHWYQETKADQVEACRNYYAQHPDADTRVLERLTEISWKLRVDRMNGVLTEHV